VRGVLGLLGRAGNDLARDGEHVARVLAGLPDGDAHAAFTRTLRSVVDWRGQVVTLLDRCYLTEDVHGAMPASRLAVFVVRDFVATSDPVRFDRERWRARLRRDAD
jgi:hypothetical protein